MQIKTQVIKMYTYVGCQDVERSADVLKMLYETIKMHVYDYNHVYQKFASYEDVWNDPELEDQLVCARARIVVGYIPDESYKCKTMTDNFTSHILESLLHIVGQMDDISLTVEEVLSK